MFGFCNDPNCITDIWSPTLNRSAIENRAFSAFCKHRTECDDIVARIAAGDINISLDDDFCESDLNYIKKCLEKGKIINNEWDEKNMKMSLKIQFALFGIIL